MTMELKRKKLRFVGSVLLVKEEIWCRLDLISKAISNGDLFKRRYERLDDDSDDGD